MTLIFRRHISLCTIKKKELDSFPNEFDKFYPNLSFTYQTKEKVNFLYLNQA